MNKLDPSIKFHFLYNAFQLGNRSKLKDFIVYIFQKEGVAFETVSYIFCDDAFLLPLNKTYLKHNTFTDIITFTLSKPECPIISDIYISVERVKENTHLLKTSYKQEIHRVIFHGVLHLCGYRDKTRLDKNKMRELEDFYLNQYFVPRETI